MPESIHFISEDVVKMFPISFERPNSYDRVISEENLIDWFRGVSPHSFDTDKNSKYSYVITSKLEPNFAHSETESSQLFEFLIGGYYVRLSDCGFASNLAKIDNKDVYAIIEETSGSFRHLVDGESINSNKDQVRALKFFVVDIGTNISPSPGVYKLHILTVSNGTFSIPEESKRSSLIVDGGELD